ncbi:MAG: DoxX family protein [Hyphomonadaceae bacterium]
MATETAAHSRKMIIGGWIVAGLVGAFLAFSASLKFLMPDVVRETMGGLGWPAHHDLLIGLIEVGCVALYLVPQTAVLGAILETALLGGAIATNVRVDNPLFSHELFGVYLGVMVWGGLWLRDPRLRVLAPLRR